MNEISSSVKIASDEKSVPVMAYSRSYLCWGTLIIKGQIKASTWLRADLAPEFIRILDAKIIFTTFPTEHINPISFPEINLPVEDIITFHITPPTRDAIDFDPSEPNWQMVPISIIAGSFIIRGSIRMPLQTNLSKYLEVTREIFTPVYDVSIHSLILPALGNIHVPFILVRKNFVAFSSR